MSIHGQIRKIIVMTNGKINDIQELEKVLSSIRTNIKKISARNIKIETAQLALLKEVSSLKESLSAHMSTIAVNTTTMTNSLIGVKDSLSSIQRTNDHLTEALTSKYSVPLVAVMLIIIVFAGISLSILLYQGGGHAKISSQGIEVEHLKP